MAANSTQPHAASVDSYLASIDNERRRLDGLELLEMMRHATGATPTMWGRSIIGFGIHHYRYESGREGDTAAVGFSARKQALVIYGIADQVDETSGSGHELPGAEFGKGCVYIKKLADIDAELLGTMIADAYGSRNTAAGT